MRKAICLIPQRPSWTPLPEADVKMNVVDPSQFLGTQNFVHHDGQCWLQGHPKPNSY